VLGPIDGADTYLQTNIGYEVNVCLQRTVCDETGIVLCHYLSYIAITTIIIVVVIDDKEVVAADVALYCMIITYYVDPD
jgi:hypothetical protein